MVNNSGPSKSPSKCLTKTFQYTDSIKLNNNTSTYSFFSAYVKPDIKRAIGAQVQFAAFELWRLKEIKVSIQMAETASTSANPVGGLASVPSTVVWTAADYGANESVSGETIMQYQNAKKNAISLNKFVRIVDTKSRLNLTPGSTSGSNLILPADTWVNTAVFASSDYSGYQLFIQNFGTQNGAVEDQPAYTRVTELVIEFMQPAFQNNASAFSSRAFDIVMVTQPDSSDPTDKRTYVFHRLTVQENASGEREMLINLNRQDGVAGSLTFTSGELRDAISTGTSGQYFGGRPIIYDGPFPPTDIPDLDFELSV
jgi:hypothetical protein